MAVEQVQRPRQRLGGGLVARHEVGEDLIPDARERPGPFGAPLRPTRPARATRCGPGVGGQEGRGLPAQVRVAGARLVEVRVPPVRRVLLDGGEEDVPEPVEVGSHEGSPGPSPPLVRESRGGCLKSEWNFFQPASGPPSVSWATSQARANVQCR